MAPQYDRHLPAVYPETESYRNSSLWPLNMTVICQLFTPETESYRNSSLWPLNMTVICQLFTPETESYRNSSLWPLNMTVICQLFTPETESYRNSSFSHQQYTLDPRYDRQLKRNALRIVHCGTSSIPLKQKATRNCPYTTSSNHGPWL